MPPRQGSFAPPYQPPASTERPPINWSMASVLVAIAVQFATSIWWASSTDRRVSALETAFEPLSSGVLARLDERTEGMDTRLKRIEGRLDSSEGRP